MIVEASDIEALAREAAESISDAWLEQDGVYGVWNSDDYDDRFTIAVAVRVASLVEAAAVGKAAPMVASERSAAVAMLRQVCAAHGDNDWSDNLHLADVLEKHLWRHLEQAAEEARLFAALREMHWTQGDDALVVVKASDVQIGVQTYSGELLAAAIRAAKKEAT